MWLLSCSDDLFGGKRLWLRPGSTHLLGRTSGKAESGERVQYINHKSVSRKHLIINVGDVHPSDSSKLHQRTEIKVTDGSKMGTALNGEKIVKSTKTLEKKEYTIKLGSYEPVFKLVWQDVTLTCTALSKKGSRDGDVLATQKEKLAGSDIKLVTDYVSNKTTHVIGKKRNTAAALQALTQGRWLVTYEFIDALAVAVRRQGVNADGDQKMSLLEEDFDAIWPNEADYPAPSGNEPVPRPSDYLNPRPERAEVFQDFIFIFLSEGQYESLMPVVTSGGGKALLWHAKEGESRVEDVVEYVREVAGKKGNRQFRLSQYAGKGGVLLVRLGDEGWPAEFQEKVDQALDQRSMKQNEFLDTILTVDASGLRQPLAEAQHDQGQQDGPKTPDMTPPSRSEPEQRASSAQEEPEAAEQDSHPEPRRSAEPEQAPEQPVSTTKRRIRRHITQPRFKGFDDFDPSQFQRPASESPPPSFAPPSQAPSEQQMDIDRPSQGHSTQQNKRKLPAEEAAEAEEAMYESLTTGQAALKRRKIEDAERGHKPSPAGSSDEEDREASQRNRKAKEKAKKVDVKTELAKCREAEAEARRKDEEALREMADLDPSEFKNLAKVELMDLPVRERPARSADEDGRSERWDPAWNGRKNFKKFRPQGQRRDAPRLQRIIVTLEEVPGKSRGIGDEYWLNTTQSSSRSKSRSQTQSQTVRAGPSSDDAGDTELRFQRRIQRSYEEDAENAQSQIAPEEIAGRPRDESLRTQLNGRPSQTFGTYSQRKAAGKRPATQQAAGAPPAKKTRQTRLPANTTPINLDDDDDDDGLKFRRRRR